jgi:hypothetical protein
METSLVQAISVLNFMGNLAIFIKENMNILQHMVHHYTEAFIMHYKVALFS